jgi:hypothetical protein
VHKFNQEYRRRRLETQRRGERFMDYALATARLRRADHQGGGGRAGGDRPGGLRSAQVRVPADGGRLARGLGRVRAAPGDDLGAGCREYSWRRGIGG